MLKGIKLLSLNITLSHLSMTGVENWCLKMKWKEKNDKLSKQFPNPIAKSQKEEKSHDRSVFGLGTSTYTRLMAQRE